MLKGPPTLLPLLVKQGNNSNVRETKLHALRFRKTHFVAATSGTGAAGTANSATVFVRRHNGHSVV